MVLTTIAVISIATAIICSLAIIFDLFIHPQQMWIMNLVWPLTALYAGPLALIAYFTLGRNSSKAKMAHTNKPFWQSVLLGTLHCGSGCTLGDLIAANLLTIFPVVLFGSNLYGEWAADFILAFIIGIVFQYYAIKPMGHLTRSQALLAALKADTLSLTFWQIGMYGWMALCDFAILDHLLKAPAPLFWMMMQVGMLFGLLTAYPVNWWLITRGIKEKM
jgi:hypothetical protein